jgi:hypothetical protein
MAGLSTAVLLEALIAACDSSPLVTAYAVQEMDEDTLSVRVYLQDGAFIQAFYNVATGKVSFALVKEQRLYGKDNAKMGWHVHPFDHPAAHVNCAPVDFATFLHEVENYYQEADK